MHNIYDCADSFTLLHDTVYHFMPGRKGVSVTLNISFDKKDCFHLMGFSHLERGSDMEELKIIMEKFVASGWSLISVPAQEWLDGKADKNTLISAIKQADKECGSCGCDLDPLYKRALELL